MVNFVDVNPADIDTSRSGRRGRVSYPIIKAFMERNVKLSKLDLTGLDKNPQYLRSVLNSYINSHDMPIKIFQANGDMHLMRLDLNNDGTPNPDWNKDGLKTTEGAAGHERDRPVVPLDGAEIDTRFREEVGKSTK